ncbi:MAG TPA: class II glutamine amidotransferase [Myxococcaceae bacterium]|jgi:glutamine amidotransferase
MAVAFSVFTSDPNLLACELERLSEQVALVNGDRQNAVGVGHYGSDEVLLQRSRFEGPPREVWKLVPQLQSEALVYHSGPLRPGDALEEGAQPYRFRHWLFCHVGAINEWPRVRALLADELPDYLLRSLPGERQGEAAFGLFLKQLRDAGRMDDPMLGALEAGRLLGRSVTRLQALASQAGAARTSRLDVIATNQVMLLAARSGDAPLHYRLLEGIGRCERCGITESSPESQPRVLAHRRVRTVAVATDLLRPAGWLEVQKGTVLAADRKLGIHFVPL